MRFRISDAFLPESEELPVLTSPNDKVEGTIVDFSDSGLQLRYFAVIDVITRYAVVVPVERLEVVQPQDRNLSSE